jgi:nitrite reductase/ring-hydroxylating ferredoxin subunit
MNDTPLELTDSEPDSIALDDIREGELTVHVLASGRKALLFRNGAEVRAFSEVCPHMGADMTDGVACAKERTIACKWHGYVFSSDDGRFLHNPNEKLMPMLRKPSKHFHPEKAPAYRLRPIPFSIKGRRVVFGREVPVAGEAR